MPPFPSPLGPTQSFLLPQDLVLLCCPQNPTEAPLQASPAGAADPPFQALPPPSLHFPLKHCVCPRGAVPSSPLQAKLSASPAPSPALPVGTPWRGASVLSSPCCAHAENISPNFILGFRNINFSYKTQAKHSAWGSAEEPEPPPQENRLGSGEGGARARTRRPGGGGRCMATPACLHWGQIPQRPRGSCLLSGLPCTTQDWRLLCAHSFRTEVRHTRGQRCTQRALVSLWQFYNLRFMPVTIESLHRHM